MTVPIASRRSESEKVGTEDMMPACTGKRVCVPEEVVEIGAEDGRGSVFGADAAFAFTEGEAAEMVQIYRAQALLWLNLMRHQGSQL